MPATARKSRIRKSATAVEALAAPAPQVFELKNMEIEEVSIVDRPANEREFLLRKKAEKKAADDAVKAAEVAAEPASVETEVEGIDLVAAAKAAEDLKALDAAAKAAEDAKAAPAVKAAEVIADPVAAAGELATATKADITVSTPSGDVTVTVEDAPAPVSPAPQALIDKVKAATLAGIDAIAARLAKFRQDVDGGTVSSYNDSGRSEALWGHIYYLKDMLDSLYDIGGASWEIESAGDAVDKAAGVNKAHRAINASRATKLAAVHKCVTIAMRDLAGVLKEVNNDQDENEVETPGETVDAAKAAAVPVATAKAVVAPPAPVVVAPIISPEVTAQLGELSKMVNSLKTTVAVQASEIAKARNTVVASNAQTAEEILATNVPGHDTVIWPADLAAKPTRQRF